MSPDAYKENTWQNIELLGYTNLNTTKKYLYLLKERRMRAVSILDQIDRISTGEGNRGGEGGDEVGILWGG